MGNPILLSLCIPTYNRAKFLDTALERLTSEPVFANSDKIEVIISDNCSTDNTQSVARKYVEKFPAKIHYSRNSTNTGMMANFSNMLKMGKGTFLKLQNDNFILRQGALSRMLTLISRYHTEKPLLFFTNRDDNPNTVITHCHTADDFLSDVSILTTWIGGFGIWRDDFNWLWTVFEKNADNLEPNTSVLWELFMTRKNAVICQNKIYEETNAWMMKKGGYNPAEAFIRNYPAILREHMGPDGISKRAYEKERMIAYWHGFWWYFDFNKLHCFEHGGFWACSKEFHFTHYFWVSILCYLYQKLVKRPRRLIALYACRHLLHNKALEARISKQLSTLIS